MCHTPSDNTLWPWWAQLLMTLGVAGLVFVGPVIFADSPDDDFFNANSSSSSSSGYAYSSYYGGNHRGRALLSARSDERRQLGADAHSAAASSAPSATFRQDLLAWITCWFFVSVLLK